MKLLRILPALLLIPTMAHAWTPEAEKRIAERAARMAPPDLRLLISRYEKDYHRGLEEAARTEGPSHQYSPRNASLHQELERQIAETVKLARTGQSMAEVVEKLGVITHLVADANNPFHVSDSDPRLRESREDYEKYFERRMTKFPTVFYGLEDDLEPSRYFRKTFDRTLRFYPLLSEEYFRYGTRRSSKDFDDRSTAFGIASISYSRAVTDAVNVYYYIWREAGGDVRTAAVMRKGNLLLNDFSR